MKPFARAVVAAAIAWQLVPALASSPVLAAGCNAVASPSADIAPSGSFDTPANIVATFDAARQQEGCSTTLSIDTAAYNTASPQQQMLMLFNAERTDRGLGALTLDPTLLSQIDYNHSKEMAQYNFFAHQSPVNQPSSVFARLTVNPAINGQASSMSENIAAGYGTAAAAVYAYMYQDSSSGWGHRHNILGWSSSSNTFGAFNWVGIGIYNGGSYGVYYTSDFIQSSTYAPPPTADTQAPTLSAPAITSGAPGGTVTAKVSNVTDTGSCCGEAGVTGVVFYANAVTISGGVFNTVSATQSSPGVWTASLSLPAGGTLHAVAVDGSGNFTDVSASSPSSSGFTAAVTGGDHQMYINHGSGYTALGGNLQGAPAVVTLPDGRHIYIAVGGGHQLWERTDTLPWQVLAGGYCIDNPAAAVSGNTLMVACTSNDHAVYYATAAIPTGGLPSVTVWTPFGGATNFGPALAVVNGVPTVFAVGMDGQLYWRTASQSWVPFANTWCTGHPAAASSGTTAYAACHGGDNGLWYTSSSGAGWSGFQPLGGAMIDGPAIAATSSGPVFFAEGADTGLYQRTVGVGWQPLGGSVLYGAAATAG